MGDAGRAQDAAPGLAQELTAGLRAAANGSRVPWIVVSCPAAPGSTERAARQAHLQQAEADFDQLPFDATAARAFGRVAASLRRAGRKVNARAYDADERRYGVDLSAAVDGVSIGGELSRTHEATRLVAATTRGIDGVWRTRTDCLARV